VLEIGQTVRVKVLDVDRDRQRISLGLKQTQTDPWQRVIDETQAGRRGRRPHHQGGHVRRLRRDPVRRRGL
jgi:ribosomal protein S1